ELDLLRDADRLRNRTTEGLAKLLGGLLFPRHSRQLQLLRLDLDLTLVEHGELPERAHGRSNDVIGLARRNSHAIHDHPLRKRSLRGSEHLLARLLARQEPAQLELRRREPRGPDVRLHPGSDDLIALQLHALRKAVRQRRLDRAIGCEVLGLPGDSEPIIVDLDSRARLETRKLLQTEADGTEPDLRIRRAPRQPDAIL